MSKNTEDRSGKAIHIARTLAICAAIALAATAIIYVIHATEPTAQKSGATRKSAALEEVIYPKRGDYRPDITALGTVEPAREIQLSPRVSGQIISMAEGFTYIMLRRPFPIALSKIIPPGAAGTIMADGFT